MYHAVVQASLGATASCFGKCEVFIPSRFVSFHVKKVVEECAKKRESVRNCQL